MKKSNLLFACCAGLIMIGASYGPTKTYPVNHTDAEWANVINASAYVQQRINESDLSARQKFVCDSVLQAHINDIQRQVGGAIAAEKADTTKPKMKKP